MTRQQFHSKITHQLYASLKSSNPDISFNGRTFVNGATRKRVRAIARQMARESWKQGKASKDVIQTKESENK